MLRRILLGVTVAALAACSSSGGDASAGGSADAPDSNIYGVTIYGSGNGPNAVKDASFTGSAAWLDLQGDNGAITFDEVYTSGSQVLTGGPVPK